MAPKKKNKKEHVAGTTFREGATSVFQKNNLLPALFIVLYTIVEFIPSRSGEVLGVQWFYLSVVNILAALFILVEKKILTKSPSRLWGSTTVITYILFLILAGLSIVFAINKIEGLVTYARLIVTMVMVFNLFFLLQDRPGFFRLLAILLSLYLLFQSINTLSSFFNRLSDTDISKVILGLTGNAGNKNILAVSLLLKVPFVIYCLYSSRTPGRILFSAILAIAAFAIFILNARASYIGLAMALLLFLIVLFFISYQEKKIKPGLILSAFTISSIVIAFFLSQYVVKKAIADQESTTAYGTVFDRLNTISFSSEGSSSRVLMWSSAFDYIKKHPLMGSGFGNWKLASIPYEKTYVDEIRIAKHTHNDFIEVTAELGIPGGLLYLLLFFFLAISLSRLLMSRMEKNRKMMALTCLLLLTIYSVDALLNFPLERPVTQFFFSLIFSLTLLLTFPPGARPTSIQTGNTLSKNKNLFLLLFFLSFPALYITYSTHRSLIAQSKVNDDIQSPEPVTRWADIKNIFPPIPDLNSYGFPISHIKAFYLVIDKKYDAALSLLDKNANVNPYLTLTEYLKAKIYLETNRPDTALVYARKAFYAKPRARSHYEMLNRLYLIKKDSAGIDQAFREYIKYRKEAWAWDRYIEYKATLNSSDPVILPLIDSALALFPTDKDLLAKKASVSGGQQMANVSNAVEEEYQKNFAAGFDLYANKKFMEAIPYFVKASSLKPGDYLAVENIGLCYYSLSDYKKAIPYFDRVLKSYSPTDGKSEFLKAISLLNLGNNPDGCLFLRKSAAKGFPQAAEQARIYCR